MIKMMAFACTTMLITTFLTCFLRSKAMSMGVHESQSLFWERMVALSRPFQIYLLPKILEVCNAISSKTIFVFCFLFFVHAHRELETVLWSQ